MNAIVYIDGFNLYNGSLRNVSPHQSTTLKWLNLAEFCTKLLPKRTILRIRYFTAKVHGFPHDPDAPTRQDVYLRALDTLAPLVTVHRGWFASWPVSLPYYPLRYPNPNRPPATIQVLRMTEKWTDVQIATLMMIDCMDQKFGEVVLISNDSDLVPPLEMARNRFGKSIMIINPHRPKRMSGELLRIADSHLRTINKSVLAASQFPATLTDAIGSFTKPPSW